MSESRPARPIRVLQVLRGLNRGGAESPLMAALRRLDRSEVAMDFALHWSGVGDYDEEARGLGANLYVCPSPAHPYPGQFARGFRRVLREHGPYDIVHSHVGHFTGLVLRLARAEGVPVRLAHSQAASSAQEGQPSARRRAYLWLTKRWIQREATGGLAVCQAAASWLYGPGWEQEGRWRVLHSGVDLAPLAKAEDPEVARAELGIEPGAYVIGHVGRIAPQKNHGFLIDLFAQISRQAPEARLVIVGEGPARPAVEAQVQRLGLADKVIFAGVRQDILRLLRSFDVFLLPSLWEGLPVVMLEAQAAGTPLVVSEASPPEGNVVPSLVQRLSLSAPREDWVAAVLAWRQQAPPLSRPAALEAFAATPFNVDCAVRELQAYYQAALREAQQRRGTVPSGPGGASR